MSYNREWDQGKDWETEGYRGNTRERDDDGYYNEGKRRKYNNGGYEESQWSGYEDGRNYGNHGYDSNNAHHDYPENYNNWKHDQPFDERGDRPHHDRGGFQNRKRQVASEPSPHVIFLGLDPHFTEADLQSFLMGHGCTIETVTVIRDRTSGQSKGYAFAQFRSTEDARKFVDPNFPFISVPPPASHGASATAAFNKALETGAQHNGKRVKIDYSQSAGGAGQGRRGPQFSNDGTRDIGNTQAAVLLFRGLDPLSGTGAIAEAMKGCSGPGKEGAKGMKRILLVKDKLTMGSWGFAFIEFTDVQAASAVLAATMSPQLHPNGFRISDRPVAASFAHPYSFQPIVDNSYPDESCITSSVSLGGAEGTWVKYWDESSMLATMEFEVEEPQQHSSNALKEKEKREKKKLKSARDGPSAPAGPSTLPVSTKPVTLSFNKVGVSAKPSATVTSQAALLFSALDEDEGDDASNEGTNTDATEDAKAKQAQKVAPMIASRKIVNNISKWNQVQEQLSGTSSQPSASGAVVHVAPTPKDVRSVVSTSVKAEPKEELPQKTGTPDDESEFGFSDTKAITCLLCARQFKTLDQLKRHNKESDLHKKNYKDANLREIAREKVRAAKGKEQTPPESSNKSQYRDRASERRTLFNQPDMPLPESVQAKSTASSKRQVEGPPPPPSPPPPAVTPAKDAANVGNKLLKMMGWTEGSGLGTEGEGRVDPIQTAIYASGAGLGASKGKEVGKYQEGYQGYVQMAKDVARDRYGD